MPIFPGKKPKESALQSVGANKHREPTSDQKLYRSKRWLLVRKNKIALNPYCEIHASQGVLIDCTFGAPIDHIIPVSCGGAPLDQRNLLTLCPNCHDRKSAMERHKGGSLIAAIDSESGLIPNQEGMKHLFKTILI